MSYTLYSEERNGYVYFHVEGEASLETGLRFWREIGARCNASDYKKVLVVENLKGQVSVTNMYEVISQLPDFGFFGIRLAFIDMDASQCAENKFGELVASNRGITVKIFNSVAEAEAWLMTT